MTCNGPPKAPPTRHGQSHHRAN